MATFAIGFNVLFSLVGIFTYVTFYLAAPPFRLSTEKLSYLFVVYLIGLVVTPAAGYLIGRKGLRAGVAAAIAVSLLGVLLTLSHSLAVVIGGLALLCTGAFYLAGFGDQLPARGCSGRWARLGSGAVYVSITSEGQSPG